MPAEEIQKSERLSGIRRLIDAGAEIAGGAAAAAVLKHIGGEVSERVLGPREQVRVGGVLALVAAEVEQRQTYAKGFELAIHNASNFETEKVLDDAMRRLSERPESAKMPASFFERMKKTAFVHRIKIGPEEARAAKDKLSALILAKPTIPYISYGAILREATFKDPTEFFSQMYYVDVDLAEIWIYNKLTGEIITEIKSK